MTLKSHVVLFLFQLSQSLMSHGNSILVYNSNAKIWHCKHTPSSKHMRLANYIHYGENIGVEASLALDSPSEEVLQRRRKGQEYLQSKLAANENRDDSQKRGVSLAPKLVDCRFALAKVCMPLMRELEFPSNRNFLTSLKNREQSSGEKEELSNGMFEVSSDQVEDLMYVGNDAVHTLGIKAFHAPIQEEINKRMSLVGNGVENNSILRFAPIAMNPAMEQNADLILGLTGMDQVCTGIFSLVVSFI